MAAGEEACDGVMVEWGVGEGLGAFSEPLGFDGRGQDACEIQEIGKAEEDLLPVDAGGRVVDVDSNPPEGGNGQEGGVDFGGEAGEGLLLRPDLVREFGEASMVDAEENGGCVPEDGELANGMLETEDQEEQDEAASLKGNVQSGEEDRQEASGVRAGVFGVEAGEGFLLRPDLEKGFGEGNVDDAEENEGCVPAEAGELAKGKLETEDQEEQDEAASLKGNVQSGEEDSQEASGVRAGVFGGEAGEGFLLRPDLEKGFGEAVMEDAEENGVRVPVEDGELTNGKLEAEDQEEEAEAASLKGNVQSGEEDRQEASGVKAGVFGGEEGEGFLLRPDLEKGFGEGSMEDAEENGDCVPAEDGELANGKLEAEDQEEEDEAASLKGNGQSGEEDRQEGSGMKAGVSMNEGKKRKGSAVNGASNVGSTAAKKPKKKNAWSKSTSRKGGKKHSSKAAHTRSLENENTVYICPTLPHMEKLEDGPSVPILLSKICKAERVELTADRLSAGSTKGYRMVLATRGVVEGAWYFEITVEKLGPTGHTRLGWCTKKGDIQAPVGYDTHGYSYRDLEGSKVHTALREPYGEPYFEGDVIGFYINLPNGRNLAPKPLEIVGYKGSSYYIEPKDEVVQPVPDSEICYFKNGVCQGTAFKGILAGRYYPAASMYTLPGEPNCTVRFNFGPDFRHPPIDLGDRPEPLPMSSAAFCGPDGKEIDAEGNVIEYPPLDTNLRPAASSTPDTSNGAIKGET